MRTAVSAVGLVVVSVVCGPALGAGPEPTPADSAGSKATPSGGAPVGREIEILNPTMVLDSNGAATGPGVTSLDGPNALGAHAGRRVLDLVFSGRYVSDPAQCQGTYGSRPLSAARAAGDFVPSLREVASGSFTERGKPQRLYRIDVGECGASHADHYGSTMLAVFEAEALVASALLEGGTSLNSVFDFDGDGWNEVLLTQGDTHQGENTLSARLVRFEGVRLVVLRSFGEVLDDSCWGGSPGATSTFSVIRARLTAGQPPRFRVVKRSRRCPPL
jgi:hypothetical protein